MSDCVPLVQAQSRAGRHRAVDMQGHTYKSPHRRSPILACSTPTGNVMGLFFFFF